MSIVTNPEDLANIQVSGRILAESLREVVGSVRPGVTTMELDRIAERAIRSRGGVPAFLGFDGDGAADKSYPCSLCTSVNDHVVHAIPSETVVLKEGDIVGLDLGVNYKGMITDHAVTVGVGRIAPEHQRLIDVTRESLERALQRVRAGARVGDLSEAVQSYVENSGMSVVRQLVGHGVGYKLHEEPRIPNFGKSGAGPALVENMVIAIEPMVNLGGHDVVFDGEWTVRTSDGSHSAHFEHTVRVTKDGYQLLTTV